MKLSEIKRNPANPRVIKDDKFRKLVKSIEEFPEMMRLRPITYDENGVVLGGNMRLTALRELGYKEIPDDWAQLAAGLSEEQKREFVVKDNVGFGEWDWPKLVEEWGLKELQDWGLDLPEDFLEEKKADKVREDGYVIPETVQTDIELGDIIEIGSHRLMCGDSTDPEHVNMLMGGKKADMVLTDPPYNVNYHSLDGKSIANDHMEDGDFYAFLLAFYKIFAEATKAGGAWYVWHADTKGVEFRGAFAEAGLQLKSCLVWVKNTFVLGRSDYHWQHEPCLYGWKPGAAHYFTASRSESTVIDDSIDIRKLSKADLVALLRSIIEDPGKKTTVLRFNKPARSEEHPTMKPILLIAPLIENSSITGGIVADPFLGSGSTMVAAEQLGRRCYGMELDPGYCQVIVDRMMKLNPNLKMIRNGKRYN